ncbi:MAG: hypothetical protein QOJ50_407 [Cryptosporangiaceae bacterium]|nr:hypothetical protein [Cryptosporangiaceae bacterium]
MLLVQAYVSSQFVPDHKHTEGASDSVPDSVIDGGPLIDTSRDKVRTYHVPAKTIALTFDDGPDATWTPKIDAVLVKYHVKATFFVVGAQVAKYPDIAKNLTLHGHELGVHSFSHPELSELPQWRRTLEYEQTQLAIAGATGLTSSLVRFPYSSSPDAVDDTYWPLLEEAGHEGYLNVLTDVDSEDWARPGVKAIVHNAIPQDGHGGIVLMHDAGGNRSETVEALEKYLPEMQRRGFKFVTVSEAASAAVSKAGALGTQAYYRSNEKAPASVIWRGRAMVFAVQIATHGLSFLVGVIVLIGILTFGRTILLFGAAFRHARRRRSPDWRWGPPVTEPVSVIVPAYNEREGIAAAVRSIATGLHRDVEVVVVDDGSSDETADIARGLGLPNVRVVTVPNGGKSNALNTGIALASHDLIVMVDGDTVFEPESVHRLVQPFGDPRVGAVAGNVKVGNRRSVVARWQHIEYVIGFNLDRRLYDELQIMPTIPGAIGAFRRQALDEVGGVSDDTLAEDTDLTIAINRAGWRVVYEEGARAWTEAPATLGQLWTQRYRWSYGTMQALWKHRHAVTDSGRSGRFGRLGLPMLALFGIVLPAIAPLIDILAVYDLVFHNTLLGVAAWLAMLGLQLVTAIVAFRLDRESLKALWVLPLQQFLYRQLMYFVIIRSVVTAMSGARLRWQKLRRVGDVHLPASEAPARG